MRRSRASPPLVLGVLLLAGCSFGPDVVGPIATPSPSAVVAGEPGGEVAAPPTAAPTVIPSASPTASASATPVPGADGFRAEVLACASIDGSTCNGELESLDGVDAFTALVRFGAANAGDVIETVLEGPSGRISSGPYTLPGGGEGTFWAQYRASLAPGTYTLSALRNGEVVAVAELTRSG